MRLKSLCHRRPSPAILISSAALFMSLGGVGYAATQLPRNSVGSYQLRNNSVSNTKIVPGSVGIVRADTRQLQVRVSGTCGAGSAIGTVNSNGRVNCNSALPSQFGTTNNTASLFIGAAPAAVTSVALPAGSSYLGLANPTATVTPAAGIAARQHVTVSCTLTVGSNTATRSVTIDVFPGGPASSGSIPLQSTGQSGTSSVSCSGALPLGSGTAPAISVTSAINAIQIAG